MWLLFLCFLESLHVAADNGSCTGTSMRTTLWVALTIQRTSEVVNHTSRRRGKKLERLSLKRETDPKWIMSNYSVKIYRTHRPVILAEAEVHTFFLFSILLLKRDERWLGGWWKLGESLSSKWLFLRAHARFCEQKGAINSKPAITAEMRRTKKKKMKEKSSLNNNFSFSFISQVFPEATPFSAPFG